MKRVRLIEWGIIAIALIFGYKSFEGIFSFLVQFIPLLFFYNDFYLESILILLVVSVLYFVAFILIIRYSRKIAVYLTGADAAEESIPLKIGKRALLQVILIAMCAFTILSGIADVIHFIFEAVANELGTNTLRNNLSFGWNNITTVPIIITCLEIVISSIVIYHSKKIASVLIRKNEGDEIAIESNPES